MKNRSRSGQSLVEYAVGLGCVTALCMCALGFLGFLNYEIIHKIYHAIAPGHGAGGPAHASAITNSTAQPWILQ